VYGEAGNADDMITVFRFPGCLQRYDHQPANCTDGRAAGTLIDLSQHIIIYIHNFRYLWLKVIFASSNRALGHLGGHRLGCVCGKAINADDMITVFRLP
jgi:hypothetical protein